MPKILLVEDDQEFSTTISKVLQSEKYNVDRVFDGSAALDYARATHYDLIILDWQLPKLTGPQVLKELRAQNQQTVVLMLTARDAVTDKADALDGGADDYIAKPPHPLEFLARVRALLRRPAINMVPSVLKFGSVEVDSNKREVKKDGRLIELKAREFALFEFLMKQPSRLFRPDELIDRVWPSQFDVDPNVVRVAVNRIRHQLDDEGCKSIIRNVYGLGYGLNPEFLKEQQDAAE